MPDRTIVVSRALQAHFRERRGVVTQYIPNGITPPLPRGPELLRAEGLPAEFVLFAARIVPEKGLHLLLEAHGRLPVELRRAFPLVVAGDEGFTRGYARRLRERAHAEVRFLGFVHGPLLETLFANASVMVLPSTMEGLSIALLEAMAHGRCCLVSDIPPNLEAAGALLRRLPFGRCRASARRARGTAAGSGRGAPRWACKRGPMPSRIIRGRPWRTRRPRCTATCAKTTYPPVDIRRRSDYLLGRTERA